MDMCKGSKRRRMPLQFRLSLHENSKRPTLNLKVTLNETEKDLSAPKHKGRKITTCNPAVSHGLLSLLVIHHARLSQHTYVTPEPYIPYQSPVAMRSFVFFPIALSVLA